MNVKKFICIAGAISMLISQSGKCADFASEITDEQVEISVVLGSSYADRQLTVEIFAPGKSIEDLKQGEDYIATEQQAINSAISNLYMVKADSGGSFSFSYQPGSVRGLYKLRIGGERIYTPFESFFSFLNDNDVSIIVDTLSKEQATYSDFEGIFVKYDSEEIYAPYQILGLDELPAYSDFDQLSPTKKDSVIRRMYNLKSVISNLDDLKTLFSQCVFWNALEGISSVLKLDEYLDQNKDIVGLDEAFYTDIYANSRIYDSATKQALLTALKGVDFGDTDNQEAIDLLHTHCLITLFSKTESYTAIALAVEADKLYLEQAGLDFTNYSQGNIEKFKDVQNKRPFTSISDFASKFNGVFNSTTSQGGQSSTWQKGSSSGGISSYSFGGGGQTSQNTSQSTQETNEPTQEQTKQEQENNEDELKEEVFNDLDSVPWARAEILYLARENIINGRSDNTFEPNATATRGEFAKIVTLAFRLPQGTTASFIDVKEDDWFAPYIWAVYQRGLMQGDGQTFGVNSPITREDMATVLFRLLQPEETELHLTFEDKDEISQYAKQAVSYFARNNIINGISEQQFAPKEHATRAQIAKLVYQIINN